MDIAFFSSLMVELLTHIINIYIVLSTQDYLIHLYVTMHTHVSVYLNLHDFNLSFFTPQISYEVCTHAEKYFHLWPRAYMLLTEKKKDHSPYINLAGKTTTMLPNLLVGIPSAACQGLWIVHYTEEPTTENSSWTADNDLIVSLICKDMNQQYVHKHWENVWWRGQQQWLISRTWRTFEEVTLQENISQIFCMTGGFQPGNAKGQISWLRHQRIKS